MLLACHFLWAFSVSISCTEKAVRFSHMAKQFVTYYGNHSYLAILFELPISFRSSRGRNNEPWEMWVYSMPHPDQPRETACYNPQNTLPNLGMQKWHISASSTNLVINWTLGLFVRVILLRCFTQNYMHCRCPFLIPIYFDSSCINTLR